MPQVTHSNHYVPQGLIRRWSTDAGQLQINTHRLLVPRSAYPEWELRHIDNFAVLRDLYSSGADGRPVDDFEQWINTEYETPGLAAIAKVVGDAHLSRADWHDLIRLFAVQNLRTPSNYSRWADSWEREVQPILLSTLQAAAARFRHAQESDDAMRCPTTPQNELARSMHLRLTTATCDETGQAVLQAEMRADRSQWIGSVRHALGGVAKALLFHRWMILTPHGNEEWPLTDNPALCVNWHGPGKFDLLGGWGTPRGDLLMPLSPRHLLHTEIGKRQSISKSLSAETTRTIQEILVTGALRWICATRAYDWVARMRPRVVNLAQFAEEDRAIRDWDKNQRR